MYFALVFVSLFAQQNPRFDPRVLQNPQLVIPQPQEPNEYREREDFERCWNEFANQMNSVAEDLKQDKWDVKKARKAEKLWEKLRKHVGWRH